MIFWTKLVYYIEKDYLYFNCFQSQCFNDKETPFFFALSISQYYFQQFFGEIHSIMIKKPKI